MSAVRLWPPSVNRRGGTVIRPGPASVPPVRFVGLSASGILRWGRDSEKLPVARSSLASGAFSKRSFMVRNVSSGGL